MLRYYAQASHRSRLPFSPEGRRWPVGPDEEFNLTVSADEHSPLTPTLSPEGRGGGRYKVFELSTEKR